MTTYLRVLINELVKYIFEKEEANILKTIANIVRKNKELGQSCDGFIYQGIFYSDLDLNIRGKGKKGQLHPSLVPQMDNLLKTVKIIDFDKERIKQSLTLILRGLTYSQDIRDALPNCLSDALIDIRNLERTRPEAFTLLMEDNPIKARQYKQYKEIRNKIEYYIAMKLLY